MFVNLARRRDVTAGHEITWLENSKSPGEIVSRLVRVSRPPGAVGKPAVGRRKRVSDLFRRSNLRFHEQHVDASCRR